MPDVNITLTPLIVKAIMLTMIEAVKDHPIDAHIHLHCSFKFTFIFILGNFLYIKYLFVANYFLLIKAVICFSKLY